MSTVQEADESFVRENQHAIELNIVSITRKRKVEKDTVEETAENVNITGEVKDQVKGEVNSEVKGEVIIKSNDESELLYAIDDTPPWYLALGLGFQQYMLMFGGTVTMPFILSGPLCFADKPVVISNILSTILFVSGMVTFLQSTFGCRLPIIQGCTFAFLAPTFSSMALKGPCPSNAAPLSANVSQNLSTATPMIADDEWRSRILEIQGGIAVSALLQVIIGATGIVGLVLRFVGPLTVVPTIVLVGLPLFEVAYGYSSTQWGIAIFTVITITIFSQCLKEVNIPIPYYKEGQWHAFWFPCFKLFPLILSICLSWILCAILTGGGAFPTGHKARTDQRISVLQEVPWIRVPYPGQWGTPVFKLSTFIGMLAGVLASMMESIGDYYACAKISGAPPPPKHAINRGISFEGIGCIMTGVWGTGNGTTSYSENIAALGITRVGSRRVIQFGAAFMILLGIIGKFGALFTTIPDPVIGGLFIALFGLLVGVGFSPLQFVNLNSMRNLFVLGNSIFLGLVLPFWVKRTPNAINTGNMEFNQIITVLLSTPMAVGGVAGFVLDNLLPGTIEERGVKKWSQNATADGEKRDVASIHTYDIPFITPYLQRFRVVKYLPFLPYYGEHYFHEKNGDVWNK